MKRKFAIALVGLLGICSASTASSQTPETVPFYYAGGTAVDPQISYVAVGVLDNIQQATVSQDRKYVTLDVNAALTGNNGFTNFTYQTPGLGFVGSPAAVAGVARANGGGAQGSAKNKAAPNASAKNAAAGSPAVARGGSATAGRAGSNAGAGAAPVTAASAAAAILQTPGMTLIAPLK